MNRKELSAVIAECAARTERAVMMQQEAMARAETARAGIEAARKKQEEAVARQEAATARLEEIQSDAAERNKKLDGLFEKWDAEREDEKIWRKEYLRRQEKMFQDYLRRADETLAQMKEQTAELITELRDQRDERRAFREAILKLIDRLPPPPPHLRSA